MQAEKARVVGPDLARLPATAPCEVLEAFDRIFVRVFRVDALAFREVEAASQNVNCLVGKALEIDLDTPFARIVDASLPSRGVLA